jgi:hypothetical protein
MSYKRFILDSAGYGQRISVSAMGVKKAAGKLQSPFHNQLNQSNQQRGSYGCYKEELIVGCSVASK